MPDRLATTRRAALGGLGVAILTTTGCDAEDLDPRPAVPVPTGTASSAPVEDDDAALVAEVVAAVEGAAAVVAGARADPRLEPRLAPLGDLHLAHLALLDAGSTVDPTPAPASPAGGRGRLVREVTAAERDLQQRLADGALAAASGDLARVLAAMSAAVAQHVAALGSEA